ncbi:hypothetical protein FM037_23070 [Shewanella psychropiezotolerans]|uniref:Uncharacterized protein n=1 Tax=Shewanella psychropiezotolerans TaxID=2593655 RepID=A0ABX5X2Q2_9GAMM|nr:MULTISPECIES: hypothetical protein [Shewanella]MPY23552.1 hypothetical protein [Shewanella sp. YLB-07]QDO85616.1 hypothetical protein FM037_23070 [Shewanella psychropiezotolerans]
MKTSTLIAASILCASTLVAGVATASDWWRTVSVTASQGVPADHNQVCANASNQLRAQYSDITAIKTRISFDQYSGTLYCTATGQTQQ